MNYKFFNQKKTDTPQNQPIPGREAEMIQGRSGGFMFDAGIWQMLRRCLLVGTAKSTYYAGKQELTDDFVGVVRDAIAQDPARVAQEIVYASDGRAINTADFMYIEYIKVSIATGKMRPYSIDFREKVVKAYEQGGSVLNLLKCE